MDQQRLPVEPQARVDAARRVVDPPIVVVEGVGFRGVVFRRARVGVDEFLIANPQPPEPIGGHQLTAREFASLQAQLPESPEVSQRGADAALDDRKARIVEHDLCIALGADHRPDLTREQIREAPATRALQHPSEHVAFKGYVAKRPTVFVRVLDRTDPRSGVGRDVAARMGSVIGNVANLHLIFFVVPSRARAHIQKVSNRATLPGSSAQLFDVVDDDPFRFYEAAFDEHAAERRGERLRHGHQQMGVRWLHLTRVVLEEHDAIVQDQQAVREGGLEHLRKRDFFAFEFEAERIQIAFISGQFENRPVATGDPLRARQLGHPDEPQSVVGRVEPVRRCDVRSFRHY